MKQTEEKILSVGTKVKVREDIMLYGGKEAVIVNVQRGYKEYNEVNGVFEEDGLLTLENNIKNIKIPYQFDGESLKVTYSDGHKTISKYYGSYYTVRILGEDNLVLFSPERLNVLSEPTELETSLIEHLTELYVSVNAHLPIYLRGVIYAYDVTDYRNLPQINVTNEQWLDEDFKYHIKDRGFLSIFESEIVLTETNFKQAKPLTVLTFN